MENQVLGETRGRHVLEGVEQISEATLSMVQQGGRELLIRAHTLRHEIYDRPAFVEAVKQLAIRGPRTRIRVLVTDIELIKTRGHRLLQLAQRLTSSIEFRVCHQDWESDPRSFVLVDECGYVLRPRWFDTHDCVFDFNDRNEVRKLRDFFIEAWEQSESDINLQRLSI